MVAYGSICDKAFYLLEFSRVPSNHVTLGTAMALPTSRTDGVAWSKNERILIRVYIRRTHSVASYSLCVSRIWKKIRSDQLYTEISVRIVVPGYSELSRRTERNFATYIKVIESLAWSENVFVVRLPYVSMLPQAERALVCTHIIKWRQKRLRMNLTTTWNEIMKVAKLGSIRIEFLYMVPLPLFYTSALNMPGWFCCAFLSLVRQNCEVVAVR